MQTDSPFYQLFLLLRESIFYLIDLDPDLAQFYDFASVEVKELKRTIDGVYLPQRTQDPIIFVEVQFQHDLTLYQRLVTETFVYLGQQDPDNEDWLVVAIWPRRSLDPGIPGYYKTIGTQIIRVYLDELPIDIEPLGLILMRMMAASRDPEIRQLAQRAVEQSRATDNVQTIKLVKMLLAYRYPQIGAEELAKMFTFTQEEMKQTKVYQEGRQEGALSERFRVILRLSQWGMSVEEIAAVVDMDPTEVQAVLDETSEN